ncbi:MAG: hypothetical protein ACYC5H_06620 [Methylovirgula sp.]
MPFGERDLIEKSREAAFGQVVSSLDLMTSLPSQVFRGDFSEFMFLESDRMFAPIFADVVKDFLSAEGTTSCCLVNLSRTHTMAYSQAAVIFLEAQTTGVEYDAQLRSGGPSTGWLFSMDRYGCASDGGSWSIYCEKDNDVAVVALRGQSAAERFSLPLRKLHAEAIDILIRQGSAGPFPFSSLTPRWRDELGRQYGSR